MTEDRDIGKRLFSVTVGADLDRKEFVRMGRAVRYSNARTLGAAGMAAVFVTFVLSVAVSAIFLIILLAVILEFVIYMEYSSRSIADNIRAKAPLRYDFYEDGVIEHEGDGQKLIPYSRFRGVRIDRNVVTLVGRGTDIIVLPRIIIDDGAYAVLVKLQHVLGRRRAQTGGGYSGFRCESQEKLTDEQR